MNPCELVAKLNPGSPRLDGGGRGGVPEYTAQDVAAALGMVKDTFAREVFCAVWWPDGSGLVWRDLDLQIAGKQFDEWRDRMDAVVTAQLTDAQARLREDAEAETAQRRAELLLARTLASMWPALGDDAYRLTRLAAIAELRATRICSTCNGRSVHRAGELLVACDNCGGSGRIGISDAKRAAYIGRNESSYRRHWRDVYEWTLRLLADAEKEGRERLLETLGQAA